MRKKTKTLIICGSLLIVGLAGTSVGYMFIHKTPGESSAGSFQDPTLQNKYLIRESENFKVQNCIDQNNLIDILFYANEELKNAPYWKSVSQGAAVSMGQTQPVITTRIVNNDENLEHGREVFSQTLTYSMFNKTAEERFTNDDTFLYRRGKINSMTDFSFDKESIIEMRGIRPETEENDPTKYYYDRYGSIGDTLSSYILNDYTVKSGTYNQEKSKPSDNRYVFNYELNVTSSEDPLTRNCAEMYKREVKTMSGNNGYPPFSYAKLEITLDQDFKVLNVVQSEAYAVNKPINATVDNTLNYSYEYFDSYQEIPSYSDFEEHFGSAENANGGQATTEDSALDYLAVAGTNLLSNDTINLSANLFNGENSLDLNATVKLNLIDLVSSELDLLINSKNPIYIANHNKEGYISFNDTKIKVSSESLFNLINKLIPLFSGDSNNSRGLDITQIPGLEEMLNTAEVIKDEPSNKLDIVLHLNGLLSSSSFSGVNGTAVITIKNYQTKPEFVSIESTDLSVGSLNLPIKLVFKDNSIEYPGIDSKAPKLENLDPIADFVINAINNKQIEGDIVLNEKISDYFININGRYILNLEDNVKFMTNIHLSLNSLQLDLKFAYVDEKIYLSLDDRIKVSLTVNELLDLTNSLNIEPIKDLINSFINVNQLVVNNEMKFDTIPNIIDSIDNILGPVIIENNTISLDVFNKKIFIDAIENGKFQFGTDLLPSFKFTLSSNKEYQFDEIDNSTNSSYEALLSVVKFINNTFENKKFSTDILGEFYIKDFGNVSLNANLILDFTKDVSFSLVGSITLLDNHVYNISIIKKGYQLYLDLGNVAFLLDCNDVIETLNNLNSYNLGIDLNLVSNFIKSTCDGSKPNVIINNLVAILNSLSSSYSVSETKDVSSDWNSIKEYVYNLIENVKLSENLITISNNDFTLSLTTSKDITIPQIVNNPNKVVNTNSYFTFINRLLTNKQLDGQIVLDEQFDDYRVTLNGNYVVNFENSLTSSVSLNVSINELKLNVELSFVNNKFYLSVDDRINFALSIEEMKELANRLNIEPIKEFINSIIYSQEALTLNNVNFDSVESILNTLDKVLNSIVVKDSNLGIIIQGKSVFLNAIEDDKFMINSDIVSSLRISLGANKDYSVKLPNNPSYSSYETLINLVDLVNRMMETKKFSFDIFGETNVNNVGTIGINANILLDFNEAVNFDVKGMITLNDSYRVNIEIIKKNERLFVDLGSINFLLNLNEIDLMLNAIKNDYVTLFGQQIKLPFDINSLQTFIKSTNDGSNVVTIIRNLISFINTINKDNSINETIKLSENTDLNSIKNIVYDILDNSSVTSSGINVNYNNININFDSNDNNNISVITENEKTLYSKDLLNLINQANKVYDLVFKKENFNQRHLVGKLDYFKINPTDNTLSSPVIIKDFSIDILLPNELTFDNLLTKSNVHIVATIEAIDQEHAIDLTYNGESIYIIYNNSLKLKIDLNSALKVSKYVMDALNISDPIINYIIELFDKTYNNVQTLFESKSLFDLLSGNNASLSNLIVINDILRDFYIDENNDINATINVSDLVSDLCNDITIKLSTSNNKLRVVTNEFYVTNTEYLNIDLTLDDSQYTEINKPDDSQFYDLSTVENIVRGITNTAYLGNYHLTGSFQLKLTNELEETIRFDLNIDVDENGKAAVAGQLNVDNFAAMISGGVLKVYYRDRGYRGYAGPSVLRMARDYQSGFIITKRKTVHMSINFEEGKIIKYNEDKSRYEYGMESLAEELTYFILQPSSLLWSIVKPQITKPVNINPSPRIDKIFMGYDNNVVNQYHFKLNIAEIIDILGETDIYFILNEFNINGVSDYYITNFDVYTKLVSAFNTTIKGQLVDPGVHVDVVIPDNVDDNGTWFD